MRTEPESAKPVVLATVIVVAVAVGAMLTVVFVVAQATTEKVTAPPTTLFATALNAPSVQAALPETCVALTVMAWSAATVEFAMVTTFAVTVPFWALAVSGDATSNTSTAAKATTIETPNADNLFVIKIENPSLNGLMFAAIPLHFSRGTPIVGVREEAFIQHFVPSLELNATNAT